jgi:hypothetical protein
MKVTIQVDSAGKVVLIEPADVELVVQRVNALGVVDCGCGHPIQRDTLGCWEHTESPAVWGGDHDAEPDDPFASTCKVCSLAVYVDNDGDVVHVDPAELFECKTGRHLAVLA